MYYNFGPSVCDRGLCRSVGVNSGRECGEWDRESNPFRIRNRCAKRPKSPIVVAHHPAAAAPHASRRTDRCARTAHATTIFATKTDDDLLITAAVLRGRCCV